MSGFYKKAVVWLGLNEEYPDGGIDVVDVRDSREDDVTVGDEYRSRETQPRPQPQPVAQAAGSRDFGHGDPLKPAPLDPERESAAVRVVPMDEPSSTATSSGTVRVVPMVKTSKPEVVVPASFNNAQDVADVYKESRAVVVDLTNAERDLTRRLIDFSAGLCYGLGGQMEKLAGDVYLLIPEGVEVSAADRNLHT